MKKACFPGSFDPFTKGHEDVVQKALGLFDEIVIGVGYNTSKTPYYLLESRIEHIKFLFQHEPRVVVKTFTGLTITFAQSEGCTHLLRGLRDVKDFNYETPIAVLNRQMSGLETVFILPEPSLFAINSSIIREIQKSGGNIDAFVTNASKLVLA